MRSSHSCKISGVEQMRNEVHSVIVTPSIIAFCRLVLFELRKSRS